MRHRTWTFLRALALFSVISGVALTLVTLVDTLFQFSQDCVTDYDLIVCYSTSSLPEWVSVGWLQ